MAFCKNCGLELEEGASFCPNCGTNQAPATAQNNTAAQNDTPAQNDAPAQNNTNSDQNSGTVNEGAATQPGFDPNQFSAPIPPKASGVLNIAQLVWAVINLLCCCTPLGIAALILTVMAKDAPTAEEEAKKLKTAKTCNIIGTVGGVVIEIVIFVLTVLGALGSAATTFFHLF